MAGLAWSAPVSCVASRGRSSTHDPPQLSPFDERSARRAARARSQGVLVQHPHPNATLFGVLLCLPTAPGLPLCGNGDFGTSSFFWAALGQAVACPYLVNWDVGRKAQGLDEKLNAEHLFLALAPARQLERDGGKSSEAVGSLQTHNVHEYEKVLGVEGPRCLHGPSRWLCGWALPDQRGDTRTDHYEGNQRPEGVRDKSVHAHTMRALAWDCPLAMEERRIGRGAITGVPSRNVANAVLSEWIVAYPGARRRCGGVTTGPNRATKRKAKPPMRRCIRCSCQGSGSDRCSGILNRNRCRARSWPRVNH
jgi:hypothetical protein